LAADPGGALTATTQIPLILLAIAAAAIAFFVILDLRKSRWWRMRSEHGLATVYLFYKHGERLNLDALRAFEQAEYQIGKPAEFLNCELPYHKDLAEQFGVDSLPTIVIRWEALRDGELLTYTQRESITEKTDVVTLVQNALANAPSLAVPHWSDEV
jgi:hypothetical protein